jgi:TonB-dependent starch-binding outer membrane protein SusC
MKKIRWLFAIALAIAALPSTVFAQERGTIAGVVTDQATQQPLAGVQVQVVGTQLSSVTDQQGRFLILNVPVGARTVRATLIGYGQGVQPVTVTAGATANVTITMETSAIELDQIVVSAITGQAERRREMGTNVGTINVGDINQASVTRVADVLTGRVPGVTLQQSAGTVGSAQRIRIRGANSLSLSNEPLVFVDGVQFSNQLFGLGVGGGASSRINDINTDDIETFEILKGPAATSQYGTAAANGVILITTKRGLPGPTQWRVYSEVASLQDRTQYPDNIVAYQVLTPGAALFNANGTVNIGPATSTTFPRRACHNHQAAQGLCSQDSTAVFNTLMDPRTRPFTDGYRRKLGLNAQGGGDRGTYFLSGDIDEERGVIAINTQDRANVRGNFTARLSDRTNASFNSGYTRSSLRTNSNDNSVVSPLINGYVGRAFFNPDSATYRLNYRGFAPGQTSEEDVREHINRLTLGGQANHEVFDWLRVNANGGLDWTNRFYELSLQPGRVLGLGVAPGSWGIGRRLVYRSNQFLYTVNSAGVASFRPMEKVGTQTTVGVSFQRDLIQFAQAQGFGTVEGTKSIGTATGQFTVDEGFDELRTIGAFITQQVSYDDRVFLTLGIRGDDNSAFGADFGLVTYPNANLSWVVNEESWFPESNVLSALRVRAGYGTSGLRPEFRQATTLYGPTGVQVGAADLPAVFLDATGNPGLKPERTTEYEAGFDAGLFGDRLSAEFTYYNKTSRDALVSVPLPPSFGLTATRLDNLARIRNTGMEIGLDARVFNYDRNQAALNLRLSTATHANKVLEVGGANDIVIGRGDQRHRVGYPVAGFFQDAYVYQDLNGDGKLDPRQFADVDAREFRIVRDTVDGVAVPNYLGPKDPTLSNSLSADLTLFRFLTINTLFEQRSGHYTLDYSTEFRCRTAVGYNDRGCRQTADPNAPLADQAAFIAGSLGSRAGYIHPADFIKWRELSVSIGVPERFQHIRGLQGANLTIAGRNLATWTDYPGTDPEIYEGGAANLTQNEFNSQPPVRYFTARLSFTF